MMKRVLVVGEDPDRPHLLASLLEGAGCIVEQAPDGWDSPAKSVHSPPDAVFLHCDRAVERSRAFIDACRSAPEWAFVPIALVASPDFAAEASLLTAHALLTRPYGLASLMHAVEYVAQVSPPQTIRITQPGPPPGQLRP